MLKQTILDLFYLEHLQVKQIANQVNTSSAYITKIIKNDTRYVSEKEYRKSISKTKRKVDQNNFIKAKRAKERSEDNYRILQVQHEQDARELSKTSHLSDENYRKWNYSAYQYNPLKKRYEFDSNIGRAADVPKYIKIR